MAKNFTELDSAINALNVLVILYLLLLFFLGFAIPIAYVEMTPVDERQASDNAAMFIIWASTCVGTAFLWTLKNVVIQLCHAVKDTAINTEVAARHASFIAEQMRMRTEAVD